MKSCIGCIHAKWETTKSGRLHPSGDGRCTYQYVLRPIPASMYWINISIPTPSGGHINRRKELKDHCVYYARDEK